MIVAPEPNLPAGVTPTIVETKGQSVEESSGVLAEVSSNIIQYKPYGGELERIQLDRIAKTTFLVTPRFPVLLEETLSVLANLIYEGATANNQDTLQVTSSPPSGVVEFVATLSIVYPGETLSVSSAAITGSILETVTLTVNFDDETITATPSPVSGTIVIVNTIVANYEPETLTVFATSPSGEIE
jgi:hypothetical protein